MLAICSNQSATLGVGTAAACEMLKFQCWFLHTVYTAGADFRKSTDPAVFGANLDSQGFLCTTEDMLAMKIHVLQMLSLQIDPHVAAHAQFLGLLEQWRDENLPSGVEGDKAGVECFV